MPTSLYDAMRWLDKRLDSIERVPGMWGSPLAVELQYILLLEVRLALTIHPAKLDAAIKALRERWQKGIHEAGYRSIHPLADQLDGDFDALVEHLRKLRESVA